MLDVYVFGIVVDAAMYALIALFCVVASTVRAPPTLDSPVPSSDVNVEPFSMKLVVDAVVNDPYVVDDRANRFTPEKKLVSANSVDDAAPDSEVRKPASLLNHDNFTDDEAMVLRTLPEPRYVKPCDSPVNADVPVAVKFAVFRFLVNAPSPTTDRFAYGEVVPRPREPDEFILKTWEKCSSSKTIQN